MDSVGAQHPPPRPSWPFLSGDPTTCDTGQWGNQPTAGLIAIALGLPSSPHPSLLSPLLLLLFYSLIPLHSSQLLGGREGLSTLDSLFLSWAPGFRGCSLSTEGHPTPVSFSDPFSLA